MENKTIKQTLDQYISKFDSILTDIFKQMNYEDLLNFMKIFDKRSES